MSDPSGITARLPNLSSSQTSGSARPQKRKQSFGLPSSPASADKSNDPASSQPRYHQPTIPALFASNSQPLPSPTQPKRPKTDSPLNSPSLKDQPDTRSTDPMLANPTARNGVNLRGSDSGSGSKAAERTPLPAPLPPRNGARKLVVKNFRQTPRAIPDTFIEKTWNLLDAALTAIFDETDVPTSMEELYRGTENLCRADKASTVYERLKARCIKHISVDLKTSLVERSARREETVKLVASAWTKWCDQLRVIRSIFYYLDRSYLLASPTLPTLWEMGLKLFSTYIITDAAIKPDFLNGVFSLFEHDRKGQAEQEQTNLLVSCTRMISNLGLYSNLFSPKFLNQSEEYFRVLANNIENLTVAEYAAAVTNQIDSEIERCERYNLEQATKSEVIHIIEKEMIGLKIDVLNDPKGVADLIDNKDERSLSMVYSLLDRVVDVGETLKTQWSDYIKRKGEEIVEDHEHEGEMVTRLLNLKETLDSIWTKSFHRNEMLGHQLRESFETFINQQKKGRDYSINSKPSEMIAKYVDMLLRSGVKALSKMSSAAPIEKDMGTGDEDAQLASQLERVLDLFRGIHGKDVFEAFYKKDLARRLLLNRSASADAEKNMLSKLKTECGSGFTHNLEIMFKDIELSRENMISFKNWKIAHNAPKNIDLSVSILAQAAWPTYAEVPFNLPEDVSKYLELYQEYYVGKHKGRKLMWRHSLAHCTMTARFNKGPKELSVSSFQAGVLLLFNETTEPLGYQYIKEATALSDVECSRTLLSLACGQHRVLRKIPMSKEIKSTDKFEYNPKFEDPRVRVKINQIQLKETKEENKATHEQVNQDRQFETQAAIIRIMKSQKTVTHLDLVRQTIEQTKKRGVLDMADIKKNIGRLIEKDYMERSENNTYVYVA